MRVITLTCPDCGTIVSANELESARVTKCPGLDCEAVLRFTDLPESERRHFLDNREQYRL
ncbi:hypothetical protein [Halosimplex amylolyticum]|uniref:hypothetical protein n=1 Tax=Halosimplex amylolyticum TaxID=3396616 RepID=UPI003F57E20B